MANEGQYPKIDGDILYSSEINILNDISDVSGELTSGVTAKDHGTATTDEVVNVCYGTGDPPATTNITEGALYIKYLA